VESVAQQAPEKTGGAISGQVLNPDGTPAISAAVAVVPVEPINLRLMKHAIAGVMQTDSAGRYAFSNIPFGRYFIAAGQPIIGGGDGPAPPVMNNPTFHPDVIDRAKAKVVTVDSAPVSGIVVRLFAYPSSVPLFKASGRVVGFTEAELLAGTKEPSDYWPGLTHSVVAFFSNPGSGPFPPFQQMSLPSVSTGSMICGAQSGPRLRGGTELLHYENVGSVAPDGRYEVRNLPAGRYRACLYGGIFSALRPRTIDEIRIGPADATDVNFQR
jgi:hypothetical protein